MINIYSDNPSMDIRRVQVTGGSSFMITLPKEWAESVGLKKNDPVMVVPQPGGGLLLSVGGVQAPSEGDDTEIDADRVPDSVALYRQLIGAYIAGFRTITVHSAFPLRGSMLESVSRFTQTSIGMEIVEEDENRIVMKDLMDITEVVPQKNIRREHLLVKRMVSDVFQAASDMDTERLEGMADRDTEVDRIHWMVQRQSRILLKDIGLSAGMGVDLRTVTGCVSVSKTLERIGDHAVLMAIHTKDLIKAGGKDLCAAIGSMGDGIVKLMDSCVQAWMNTDRDGSEECIRMAEAQTKAIVSAFGRMEMTDESLPVDVMAGSSRRLAEYCADIAEMALDSAMEKA